MSCQVRVSQGVLQGKECKTFYGKKYYSFEGIPYAKPPTGRLRFSDPLEPESWTGVLDATKPGNKCCQVNPYGNLQVEGSEDCLFLNVYTPILPDEKIEKLPVMFFVHGGRLIFGYGHYYQPDYLIKHDVILVTVNYRLNILGFLCLNTPEVPGNAGLKDTVMALKWVNKNIENFNGDPNNVTAMGESAGGGIVLSYLTSKMTDGLFHKIIAQSGTSISDLFMDEHQDPIENAKLIASNLGKELTDKISLYDFFVNAPIEDLLIAFAAAETSRSSGDIRAFLLPVVEKKFEDVEPFLESNPRIDTIMNRFKKMPILSGTNSHEGALFIQKDTEGKVFFETDFYCFVPHFLHIAPGDERAATFEKKLREFYFENREVNDTRLLEYVDMVTDRNFSFDIMNYIDIVSRFSKNVYAYKFQYCGNMNTRVMKNLGLKGSSHGDMIQYQFYRKNKHEKATEKDIEIVETLSEAWCNFAKNGKPSWSDNKTKWLPYTPAEKQVLVIDEDIQLVKYPDLHRLKFWQSITGSPAKL